MPRFLKFILLAIPVLGLGIFMGFRDHGSVEQQEFSGTVISIEWKSRNHGVPLIEIGRDNGTKTKFHHYRISLEPNQLKLGDSISKEKGSKDCKINQRVVQCIK